MKITTLLVWPCVWLATQSFSVAVTVPAGTPLMVRTLSAVSSHERVGRVVKAELERDVVVNGKVVLPAGTRMTGRADASMGDFKKSSALGVNVTDVSVNGRHLPVKTTGAFKLEPSVQRTRGGAAVYHRDYTFPHHTKIIFRLAQPLNL